MPERWCAWMAWPRPGAASAVSGSCAGWPGRSVALEAAAGHGRSVGGNGGRQRGACWKERRVVSRRWWATGCGPGGVGESTRGWAALGRVLARGVRGHGRAWWRGWSAQGQKGAGALGRSGSSAWRWRRSRAGACVCVGRGGECWWASGAKRQAQKARRQALGNGSGAWLGKRRKNGRKRKRRKREKKRKEKRRKTERRRRLRERS